MAPATLPKTLQIGSGRSFHVDCLNLDVDPGWEPDVVADIGRPLCPEPVSTRRFGEIVLQPGSFDGIVAHDVLEHIPDLVQAMTNCLALLREEGRMDIKVPYDLSLGAWQDPTHVRAFNENSFAYFCEWFWYLGWETHRFHKQAIDLIPSETGKSLAVDGVANDVICRTPRAIDSIHAVLVKQPLADADRAEMRRHRVRQTQQGD